MIALLLTKEEVKKVIYCIDLILQNFGENEDLKKLRDKIEMQ